MIYSNVSADQNLIQVCTIAQLGNVHWKGDDKADEFFHEFNLIRDLVHPPLPDPHVRDMLHFQMMKSKGLEFFLIPFNEKDKDERTLEEIEAIMTRWLAQRHDARLLRIQMGEEDHNDKRLRQYALGKSDKGGKGKDRREKDKKDKRPSKGDRALSLIHI